MDLLSQIKFNRQNYSIYSRISNWIIWYRKVSIRFLTETTAAKGLNINQDIDNLSNIQTGVRWDHFQIKYTDETSV